MSALPQRQGTPDAPAPIPDAAPPPRRRGWSLTALFTSLIWLGALVAIWAMPIGTVQHFAFVLLATYLLAWGLAGLLSPAPSASIRKRFVLMTVSLLFLGVLFEVAGALKWVEYRTIFATEAGDPMVHPAHRLDPELLHIWKPYRTENVKRAAGGDFNTKYCLPVSGPELYDADFVLRYDAHGFRNDRDLTRADIAVIGDSFIEGGHVSTPHLLTTILADRQRLTVANLGHIMYGPAQELLVLKRYALPLHPKLIVWAFFEGNDLRDVYNYKDTKAKLDVYARHRGSLWKNSFLRNALQATFRLVETCEPPSLPIKKSGLVRDADGNARRMYFFQPGLPFSKHDDQALRETGGMIAEAFALAHAQQSRFLLVFIPQQFRVYRDRLTCEESSDCMDWVVNDLPDRVRETVRNISPEIAFLDLTPAFRQEAAQGPLLYHLEDSHWTAAGHRLAAETIDAFLKSR